MSLLTSLAVRWPCLVPGAVGGALLGVALYFLAFSGNEAVAIAQVSRVAAIDNVQTRVTPQLVIDRRSSPQLLVDAIQTRSFAERLATQVGKPEWIDELPARQYGGEGKLRARSISDGSLIEIRTRASTKKEALEIVGSAIRLAIEDDLALMSPIRELAEKRVQSLREDLARAQKSYTALVDASSSSVPALAEEKGMLLSGASEAQARLASIQQQVWEFESALTPPLTRKAAVFSPPTIIRPLVRSWWLAALIGAVMGMALALALALVHGLASSKPATD